MLSPGFHVSNGVRQGGILSPYLFNVYMDDLSIALNGCHTGYVVDNIPVNHLLYADDLVVFAPSISGLRELLKVYDVFADSHDIKYNPNKSQELISRGKFLSGVNIPPFCIGGSCIPETDRPTVKYLGHFICNTMRDDTDILRQRRQLYARANVLARKFYMCTDEVKVLLFRTLCCNLYTCQLWWNFTQTAMRKINVAYNNAFRMIMQLPRYCSASNMFAMCNVPSCQAVMRNLVYRFTIGSTCGSIGVQTNYYVPLAAVISDITHELGNTGCRHFMCIFVRDYYRGLYISSTIFFFFFAI